MRSSAYGTGGGTTTSPPAAPAVTGTVTKQAATPSPKDPQSKDPVRLSDGTLDFQATDLESNAFSTSFGQVRGWTNNPAYVSSISDLGNGWTLDNIPTLLQPEGRYGPQIILENGATVDTFTSTFSWYLAQPLPPASDYPDDEYLTSFGPLGQHLSTPVGTNSPYSTGVGDGGGDDGPGELVPNPLNPNYAPAPTAGQLPPQYTSAYYKPTQPVYAPQYDDANTLTYSSGNDTYTWSDPQGDRYVFSGSTLYNSNAADRLQTSYSPLGGSVTSYSYNGWGYISQIQRTGTSGTTSVTEDWIYSYSDNGTGGALGGGQLQSVLLERSTNGGASSTVGSVDYQYYDGSTIGGNAGDLEDATVFDSTGQAESETFYRYYLPGEANGYTSGLEYAFTAQAFDRLAHALPAGVTPDTASNAQIAPYSTQYFQYNSQIPEYLVDGGTAYPVHQVTQETVSGFGSNEGGGSGDGTINFQYSTSANYDTDANEVVQGTGTMNVWWYKTVETYGDGSSDTYYLNSAGLTILSSHDDPSGAVSSTWNQYNAQGFVTETAEPSAVLSFDESSPDLLDANSLSQNSGLIYTYTWDETAGQMSSIDNQQGADGTPVEQEQMAYESLAVASTTMEVITSDETFNGGVGQLTTYQYSAFSASMPLEIITTQPANASAQNGQGTAPVTEDFYDADFNLRWEKDPNGNVSYWNYDLATGALIQSVQEVNTATFTGGSSLPAGLTGTGANLSTTYEVDDQGNDTEETDPNGNITYTTYDYPDHTVRVYPGWHQIPGTTTYTTTGPVQVEDDDWADGYTDTLTYAPGALDQAVPDGTDPIADLQTLSRSETNDAGQTVATDQYFNLPGLTYSPDTVLGTVGTNFYQTTYGYNTLGYQNEVTDPNGTVVQNTYDSLGRLISNAVGTTTSGLTDVADYQYSNGGTANGDLTQITEHPGGGAPDRVTQYFYNYLDQQIGELDGAGSSSGILYFDQYDSLGNPTLTEQFAVGNTTITDAMLSSPSTAASTSPAAEIPTGLSQSQLRAESAYSWDNQNQLYREQDYSVNQTTGAVGTSSATTNYYYDADGNLIATESPAGLWTKDTFNGVGEITAQYETDGAGGTSWAAAHRVIADHVLSQDVYQYDNDGNLITDTTSDRLASDSATATNSLLATGTRAARITEQAWYYDAADRLTDAVDLGTNSSGFTYTAASPPARSASALTTTYGYNDAGWVNQETDPNGIEDTYSYDNAGNLIETIADYTGGPPTNSSDQTTEYTYDGDGNVTSMTAIMPAGTPNETTDYNYGVTGAVNSNDLLGSINYPDPTTGLASTSPSQTETYSYDALGEATSYTDRNGTTHQYSYNPLGQLTSDQVTAFGAGVDQTVASLGYTYDDAGQLATATSYDASGNVLNQVQETYDGFGQLASEAQSHTGAVTASTPTVGYTYDAAHGDRITSMTYPDGRTLNYNYSSTSIGSAASQIAGLSDASGTLQSYTYQGLATPMTMTDGNGVSEATTLDPFGRTAEVNWSNASGTSIDSHSYTYDADGDVLTKSDNVIPANSEAFTYDNLDRLTSFTRADGTSASWSLDATGNWNGSTSNGSATTRTNGAQNQILSVTTPSGDGATVLGYDNNGNTTTDENGNTLTYNAWNQLMSVKNPAGTPIASYTYDALGRRITQTNAVGLTIDLYYSDRGQVIEEQQNGQTTTQYVWSPFYVNQLVERDDQPNASGALTRRVYVEQDANYNVTSLTDANGNVVERYVYDPYGNVTVENADGSVKGDGTLASSSYGMEYLFQGGRIDPRTGLYLFGARDYDPATGRWDEQDPAGYINGANRYQVELGNPADSVDPAGLDDESNEEENENRTNSFGPAGADGAAAMAHGDTPPPSPENTAALQSVAASDLVQKTSDQKEFNPNTGGQIMSPPLNEPAAAQPEPATPPSDQQQSGGDGDDDDSDRDPDDDGNQPDGDQDAQQYEDASDDNSGNPDGDDDDDGPGDDTGGENAANTPAPKAGDVNSPSDLPDYKQWPSKPAQSGKGTVYTDPTNPGRQVREMDPVTHQGADPAKQSPGGYIRYSDGYGGVTPPLPR